MIRVQGDLAVARATIVPVPGSHDTLLLGDNAQRIASSMSALIDAATGGAE